MKIIKLLIILIFLITTIFDCYSQRNMRDSLGRKQGLWVDDDVWEQAYYKNNLLDGLYRYYSKVSSTLICLGEYSKGIPCGKWYYFDEKRLP